MRAGRVRPVIVLGPERSGTSAWAELIVRWGAYPGEPDDLPAPDRLNPHGRWEYGPLWDLLERIGSFAEGVSWWDESFPAIVAAQARRPGAAGGRRGYDRADGAAGPGVGLEGSGSITREGREAWHPKG